MDFKEAVNRTQNRLVEEGGTMKDLLGYSKSWTPPELVDDTEWEAILAKAERLPITMGAFPFGFEFPMHTLKPEADFGVSLTSESQAAATFRHQAKHDESDILAHTVLHYLDRLDSDIVTLRDIVGRKLMLEFDIGSAHGRDLELPGFFLRPGQRPIIGEHHQSADVFTVAEALVSSLGWQLTTGERTKLKQIYAAQPSNVRMESFGIFPSRGRSIRLAVMGFETIAAVGKFLEKTEWPGNIANVLTILRGFQRQVSLGCNGLNLDVQENQLGTSLGITATMKPRYTNEPNYWIDDPVVWTPFLDALKRENFVYTNKIKALSGWLSKPQVLYGKAGCFILLRGIHHMKIVITDAGEMKAKAYVFMILTAADNI